MKTTIRSLTIATKQLPEDIRALLTIAGCSVAFKPERWNRGARKKAFWWVSIAGTNVMVSVPDTADIHVWKRKITKLLDYAARHPAAMHAIRQFYGGVPQR